jgi:hypothetical protein
MAWPLGPYSLYVGPVEGLIRTGDGDRLVMAYLWMRLSGEELGRYEGYYGVFRDYGADEGMRHYKSFLIMQRFIAAAWQELSERFLEVFRYPVDRVLNITPTPDGVVVVQNEWDGRLRTWMIPSIATLR